jgi:hypothetical protein
MKIKNHVLIIVAAFFNCGCQQVPNREQEGDTAIVEAIHDTESALNRTLRDKPFSNPALIYGTDFLSYLGAIKATTGDLNTLLRFTADESIKRLGATGVRWWWAHHNINCQKKLKSLTRRENSYWMTYEILVNQTRKIIQIEVRIENDSCRFVIPPKSEWFPEQEK